MTEPNRTPARRPARAWTVVALGAAALTAATGGRTQPAPPQLDPPQAAAHVAKATLLAGEDLKAPLFLCRPDSGAVVRQALETGSTRWVTPTRLFDNLFYVGNEFVGVLILKTSEGLILFDSSSSPDEARDHLAPGLKALGLNPAAIRYVIVTHGHYDHFGGAAWLQKTYGARIGLSQADWTLIEKAPANAPGQNGRDSPKRDVVITDGQTLTLGDTAIRLYITPGHTPGTVSAIVPAKESGVTHPLSLLGSVAFPASLKPTASVGGLLAYRRSVERFARISREAGTQGLLNTHVFADGGLARLAAARERRAGAPNPFLVGPGVIKRYYGLLDECLQAAIERPHGPDDEHKPSVPPKA